MTDFPLTKSLGLEISEWHGTGGMVSHMIKAPELEALLAKAPKVYGGTNDDGEFYADDYCGTSDTHSWLCVGKTPIRKDTAESLLEEVLADDVSHVRSDLRDRARKVLEK